MSKESQSKTRMDNWTDKEEQVLFRILCRFARESKTQLSAYEMASYRLNRTANSCAFRWSIMKKDPGYLGGYSLAIKQGRLESRKIKSYRVDVPKSNEQETTEDAYRSFYKLPEEEKVDTRTQTLDTRYNVPKAEPTVDTDKVDFEIWKNPLYRKVHQEMIGAQRRQVAYGIEKYPETLNPGTWSTIETLDHIISESVDKLHYLVMLKVKLMEKGG